MTTQSETDSTQGRAAVKDPVVARGMSPSLAVERACAVTCLVAASLIGIFAEALVSDSSVSRPGAFPAHGALWLGSFVLGAGSVGWLLQSLRRREPVVVSELAPVAQVLKVLGILIVGAWAAQWLGLLAASAATYVALLVYYRDRNWIFVLGSTVAYVLLLHYGLEVLLDVRLARSPILPLPF